MQNLFLVLALGAGTPAFACGINSVFGTNLLEAQSLCTRTTGARVGHCAPMNVEGTVWACQCHTNCATNASFQTASFQRPAFSCSCHALDPSNQFNEAACNALSVGTTCNRVGNLICIPQCG